jgi:hypothetical protein
MRDQRIPAKAIDQDDDRVLGIPHAEGVGETGNSEGRRC